MVHRQTGTNRRTLFANRLEVLVMNLKRTMDRFYEWQRAYSLLYSGIKMFPFYTFLCVVRTRVCVRVFIEKNRPVSASERRNATEIYDCK